MSKTSLFLFAVMALVLISAISCNEKNKESHQRVFEQTPISKEVLKSEAWQMEELYWDYVVKLDTVAYKKLWHNEFIGYPAFGDGVSNKSKIAIWIPKLHSDPDFNFDYKLYKKAVNVIDDVVIVFYDADYIWTDRDGKVVRKVTKKFTHTWKKYEDTWLILGGMAAEKL